MLSFKASKTYIYMPSKDISLTAIYIESTGINNNVIDDKTFLCYPNPTSSSFSIDLSLIGNSNIDIYNSIGESVYNKVALTAQTTASIADFTEVENVARKKFPQIEVFNTICNATSQRQAAITKLAPTVDIMLVVGSKSSANSNRLVQISKAFCSRAYLIDSALEINPEWFEDENKQIDVVGLSAGASTPDFLIEGVIEKLKEFSQSQVHRS